MGIFDEAEREKYGPWWQGDWEKVNLSCDY